MPGWTAGTGYGSIRVVPDPTASEAPDPVAAIMGYGETTDRPRARAHQTEDRVSDLDRLSRLNVLVVPPQGLDVRQIWHNYFPVVLNHETSTARRTSPDLPGIGAVSVRCRRYRGSPMARPPRIAVGETQLIGPESCELTVSRLSYF